MSDSVALNTPPPGAAGPATPALHLRDATLGAAWNLQGDASDPVFAAQVRRAFDLALPTLAHRTATAPGLLALWQSPSSWLLLSNGPLPAQHRLTGWAGQRDAFNALGGALFDVSAARVGWTIGGPGAATLLNSACPLDLHPQVFAPGSCAQTVFGHVGALLYRHANLDFSLFVARSFAREVGSQLGAQAAAQGCEFGAPALFCA